VTIWLVVSTARDEWHDPNIAVHRTEDLAKRHLIALVAKRAANQGQNETADLLDRASVDLAYQLATLWDEDQEEEGTKLVCVLLPD
jgi:hypothetical protein